MRVYLLVILSLSGCTFILGDRESSSSTDGSVPTQDSQDSSSTSDGPASASLHLDAYCHHVYGANTTVVSVSDDGYGWRCDGGDGFHAIDMQDACHYQLGMVAVADLGDVHDKNSWRCSDNDPGYVRAVTGGIDLPSQCSLQYGNTATLVSVDTNQNGWRCQVGNTTFAIDLQAACQRQYSTVNAIARAESDFDRNSWACYVPEQSAIGITSTSLDFTSYCQTLFGPSASASALEANAYGWRCTVGADLFPIDVTDACRRQSANRSVGVFSDFSSPFSWTCLSVPNH